MGATRRLPGARGPVRPSPSRWLVAVAALASAPIASSVAADSASDIPGVPMPAGVVTGRLGGDIYDVVYSLDVEPGSVILASLEGPSGTDFELYLIDATATTVVTNVGVVAKSTSSTSSESLSHPAPIGGRFYVDLNSATAAAGTYTLVVQVIPDRPSVATVVLDAGRERTSSTIVSASVTASGSLSGPVRMAFSADGRRGDRGCVPGGSAWTFPVGDGTKTLWAKVENGAGLASAPASDAIVLDTEQPGVTSVDPPVNADLVGVRPTVTVTFSEPIDPASWALVGLVVQTPGGTLVSGTYTMGSAPERRIYPDGGPRAGRLLVLSVGRRPDVAGNLVASIGSWLAVDRPAPEISVTAGPRIATGAPLAAQRQVNGSGGRLLAHVGARPSGALGDGPSGSVPVGADGRYSVRVTRTPRRSTASRSPPSATTGPARRRCPSSCGGRHAIAGSGIGHPGGSRRGEDDGRRHRRAGRASVPVAFRLERWSSVSRDLAAGRDAPPPNGRDGAARSVVWTRRGAGSIAGGPSPRRPRTTRTARAHGCAGASAGKGPRRRGGSRAGGGWSRDPIGGASRASGTRRHATDTRIIGLSSRG